MEFVHEVIYEMLDELKSLADGTEVEVEDNGSSFYADKVGTYEKTPDGLRDIFNGTLYLWEDIDEAELFCDYKVYTDVSDGIDDNYDFINWQTERKEL